MNFLYLIASYAHIFKCRYAYVMGAATAECADIKGFTLKCRREDGRFPFMVVKQGDQRRPRIECGGFKVFGSCEPLCDDIWAQNGSEGLGLRDGGDQLPHELGPLDRDLLDLLARGIAEGDPPLQRAGGVVDVHDDTPGPLDGLEGALDEVLPRLHQHLHRDVLGDAVLLDEAPQEVVEVVDADVARALRVSARSLRRGRTRSTRP